MQIAMKGARGERRIEKGEHEGLDHLGAVEAGRTDLIRVVDPDALDVLHGEHLVGTQLRIELRYSHLRRVLGAREAGGPVPHGLGFQSEVELFGEIRLKVLHHLVDVRHAAHLGEFQAPGDLFEDLQIGRESGADRGALDLDDDCGAVLQCRLVHLGDGRRGKGNLIEGPEHVLGWGAELVGEHGTNGLRVRRWYLIEQRPKLRGEVLGEHPRR